MDSFLQNLVRDRAIVAVAGIIMGAVLIIFQASALDFMVWILGIIALVAAAAYALSYAFGTIKNPGRIAAAVICACAGLLFVTAPQAVVDFLPLFIGLILLVNGITNCLQSFAAAGLFGSIALGPALISALVAMLGLLIMMRPGAVADFIVVFMGISLIVSSVFDIYLMIVDRRRRPIDIYVR